MKTHETRLKVLERASLRPILPEELLSFVNRSLGAVMRAERTLFRREYTQRARQLEDEAPDVQSFQHLINGGDHHGLVEFVADSVTAQLA